MHWPARAVLARRREARGARRRVILWQLWPLGTKALAARPVAECSLRIVDVPSR
jgi:hypothetical protein